MSRRILWTIIAAICISLLPIYPVTLKNSRTPTKLHPAGIQGYAASR